MIVWSLASWHVALARNLSLTCSPILYSHSERVCHPHSSRTFAAHFPLQPHSHCQLNAARSTASALFPRLLSSTARLGSGTRVCVCQPEPLLLPCSVRSCRSTRFSKHFLYKVFSLLLYFLYALRDSLFALVYRENFTHAFSSFSSNVPSCENACSQRSSDNSPSHTTVVFKHPQKIAQKLHV